MSSDGSASAVTAASRPTRRVVLLHGVGLDRHMWGPVAERLTAAGLEVSALDLLGHGEAPPAPAGTTLADLGDAVARALAGPTELAGPTGPTERTEPTQPTQPTHLVGFSLGALVAQDVALRHPELVATLASVNSVCRRTEEERAAVRGRLATAGTDFAAGVEAAIERWYAGTGVPADIVEQTRTTLLANDLDSYLACYRVFAEADAEVGPRLGEITVPALAITGSDDPGSTPEMSRRLGEALPHCRVVVVDGARHMLPVQDPDALADELLALVGSHSKQQPHPPAENLNQHPNQEAVS